MALTIKDIAKLAGVSPSTVSRSLNDHPRIPEGTRLRIKRIAEETGFEFNSNARGLSSSNKTDTIGVIFPQTFDEIVSGFFYNYLMKKVQFDIEKHSLDNIVGFPENRFDRKSNIVRLIDRRKIDGFIIATPYFQQSDYDYIVKNTVPHVFLHNRPQNLHMHSLGIFTDHVRGGYMAAEYLIKRGHRRIMVVQQKEHDLEFRERTDGFIAAHNDAGLRADRNLFIDSTTTISAGYDSIEANREMLKDITAIFFQSDIMAIGGIRALQNMGYHIPSDISVIGYDDLELDTHFHPKLTTIHQPVTEIAELAVESLLEFIKAKTMTEDRQLQLDPTLVERDSVKSVS